jgi:hypothetical protein
LKLFLVLDSCCFIVQEHRRHRAYVCPEAEHQAGGRWSATVVRVPDIGGPRAQPVVVSRRQGREAGWPVQSCCGTGWQLLFCLFGNRGCCGAGCGQVSDYRQELGRGEQRHYQSEFR